MGTKKFLILLVLFFFSEIIFSAPVSIETAKNVANNWYFEKGEVAQKDISIENYLVEVKNNDTLFYVFNINTDGFVIVSAEDIVVPVLGYTFNGHYTKNNHPVQFDNFLANFKEQIIYAKKKKLMSSLENTQEWNRLSVAPTQLIKQKYEKAVPPLITTTWDQIFPYNNKCPLIGGQRCLVGCVAVAMAQVMKYHNYPLQGIGSYSYYDSGCAQTISANFGNTIYNWANMPNSLIGADSTKIGPTSKLLAQCGVSINTNYSLSGSGSCVADCPEALEKYFHYDTSANCIIKSSSPDSDTVWARIMRTELDSSRPIIYCGANAAGDTIHAFVMDGYQGTNYFHFNWGWEGSCNNYFYLNNLNPGSFNLTFDQGAVVGIKPLLRKPGWVVYDTSNSGLPNNDVNTIAIAGVTKWIGTWGSGVAKFDDSTWTVYDTSNSELPFDYINTIGITGPIKWIGTNGEGLAKFDDTHWTIYNWTNSDFPNDYVYAFALGTTVVWFATSYGVAKFDGTNWTSYNTNNSGLPFDWVISLAAEGTTVWIGTNGGGLAKFDGTNWTTYNISNSELPNNYVHALAIQGTALWIGTNGGLAKYDSTKWTVYNPGNSGLLDNRIRALAIKGTTVWVGTDVGGLTKFDGTNWTTYHTNNSGLPENDVQALAIEGTTVWIGTGGAGVASYTEQGIEEKSNIKNQILKLEIRKNPFVKSTIIRYTVPEYGTAGTSRSGGNTRLTIYDLSGRMLRILVNGEQKAGSYEINLESKELPTGAYFLMLNTDNTKLTKKIIIIK
ncbi:MAG: C10 family peptidase [bacterium]|nr:C10 family peptidase [bacterium]